MQTSDTTFEERYKKAFEGFTEEKMGQYKRFVEALLVLHDEMVACGMWPPTESVFDKN
jgi:hypothetical protein